MCSKTSKLSSSSGLLQCVAGRCSEMQRGVVCCSVKQPYVFEDLKAVEQLRSVAVCCSVLQYVAVCCSMLQCVAVRCSEIQCGAVCCSVKRSVLQCVALYCSMLQCGVARCSVLQ